MENGIKNHIVLVQLKRSFSLLSDDEIVKKIEALRKHEREAREIRKELKQLHVEIPNLELFPDASKYFLKGDQAWLK